MYNIQIIPAAQKDMNSLPVKICNQIKDKILPLSQNPFPQGCIKLTANDGYRIRSGNYRILYRIDNNKKTVFIYRVKHRKEAYR